LSCRLSFAKQPSSIPKGNGMIMFPHDLVQFSLGAFRLLSASWQTKWGIRILNPRRIYQGIFSWEEETSQFRVHLVGRYS
jgi:hypothetical protein